jgi:hypothetical protein
MGGSIGKKETAKVQRTPQPERLRTDHLPYAPDLVASLYARLGGYALLWLLFAGIWRTVILLPTMMKGRSSMPRRPQTRAESSR